MNVDFISESECWQHSDRVCSRCLRTLKLLAKAFVRLVLRVLLLVAAPKLFTYWYEHRLMGSRSLIDFRIRKIETRVVYAKFPGSNDAIDSHYGCKILMSDGSDSTRNWFNSLNLIYAFLSPILFTIIN